ncbi:MAG: hypothetical protein ACXWK4_02155 [Myxococcaceae bacterium]
MTVYTQDGEKLGKVVAEPIIEEVEDEVAIAHPPGGDDADYEPADDARRTDRATPDDRHVP